MSERAPRTLADQLRGWSDERLGELVRRRPDLGVPAPHDSAQLAARAGSRPSVARALDALDTGHLAVLEAALHASTVNEIEGVVRAEPAVVRRLVDELLDLALLWGEPDDLRALSTLTEILGSPPGPAAATVPELLEDLDASARAMLDHLDAQDAAGRTENALRDGVTPSSADTPLEHLVARRLVVPTPDRRRVVVPWSVRVVLRGGRSTRADVGSPPDLATASRAETLVDRAAAGAAFELVRRTELLLDSWGTSPPSVLRSGGLAVRGLRTSAVLLGIEPVEAALVVEVAYAARLLDEGNTEEGVGWMPTTGYDAWVELPAAERWVQLAQAWLTTTRATHLAGRRDESARPVNPLVPDLYRATQAHDRRVTLEQLTALGAGEVLASGTGTASVLERLRWLAPRRPWVGGLAEATLHEAALLGVTGADGLASYARLLLAGAGDAEVATSLAGLLPEPVDHVLIQADLTAVAPGPLESDLGRRIATVADVESRGGATVYRFSAASVRRAFDAGWSTTEITDFLRASSRTPVPQALEFLVADVARRFGTVRVGAAETFLRSDDEAALTELVTGAPESLRLRRIAPTVVVSNVPVSVLLPRLREAGVAPVVEGPDGTVQLARPDVSRARTPRRRTTAPEGARQAAHVAAVVTAVRAGDRVAASRSTSERASTPADVLTLVREVADEGGRVLIEYVDNDGARVTRLVAPQRIDGGSLVGVDARTAAVATFAVHRIRGAWRL